MAVEDAEDVKDDESQVRTLRTMNSQQFTNNAKDDGTANRR